MQDQTVHNQMIMHIFILEWGWIAVPHVQLDVGPSVGDSRVSRWAIKFPVVLERARLCEGSQVGLALTTLGRSAKLNDSRSVLMGFQSWYILRYIYYTHTHRPDSASRSLFLSRQDRGELLR